MKVMMFARATRHTEAGQRPAREAVVAMHHFNEELQRAGVLLDLGGLLPSSRGVRVRYRGGTRTVVEGPFSETRELIAGYALIEVKTFAEAVEWAKRAPLGVGAKDGDEVEVELRPIIDPTPFDPDEALAPQAPPDFSRCSDPEDPHGQVPSADQAQGAARAAHKP